MPTYRPLSEVPDFGRAGGECVCETCGKEFRQHPWHYFTDAADPAQDNWSLKLVRVCSGRFYKL